ncbi:DUF6538 domain-containing protein, partial [Caulobacter sp.]|uniref:DUF6538 domain-containing protein n=1 Tax=Caulobacter sp. TaxID=78 RepID=UPI002B4817BB
MRVPRALRQSVGRTHFWRSLATSRWEDAIREARLVAGQFEEMLRRAEGLAPSVARFDNDAVHVHPTIRDTASAGSEKTLRQVVELHQSDPSKTRSPKTVLAYRNTFEVIGEIIDLDRPIGDINREDCRRLLETLRWLPSNPTKRFPKLGIVQAAEMAKRKKLASTLGPATINAYLNRLSTVMNFAVNEGLIAKNPMRGLKVADPVRAQDKRSPFSNVQLQRIFHAPIYTGCQNDGPGYAEPGPSRPQRGRYWVPLIGLFAGMRLNEICQLDLVDVQEVDGVACFHVRPDPMARGRKRLKTRASERLVPVHPMLIDAGFLDYVARQRSSGSGRLFPDLRPSSTGYYSDPFSKWFSRFLQTAGAAGPKTCFHSMRHNFKDALRAANVDQTIGLALGGWSIGAGGNSVAEGYGRGHSVHALAAA